MLAVEDVLYAIDGVAEDAHYKRLKLISCQEQEPGRNHRENPSPVSHAELSLAESNPVCARGCSKVHFARPVRLARRYDT